MTETLEERIERLEKMYNEHRESCHTCSVMRFPCSIEHHLRTILGHALWEQQEVTNENDKTATTRTGQGV